MKKNILKELFPLILLFPLRGEIFIRGQSAWFYIIFNVLSLLAFISLPMILWILQKNKRISHARVLLMFYIAGFTVLILKLTIMLLCQNPQIL